MSDFEREFDEWRAKSYEWYKKKRAEGLSDEQTLELFWGKETLEAIKSTGMTIPGMTHDEVRDYISKRRRG